MRFSPVFCPVIAKFRIGDGFDLDIELVMKLVRKGYLPLEIPVNYTSRSFAEGKKVRFIRDPLTWVSTILRHGFSSIGPGRVAPK